VAVFIEGFYVQFQKRYLCDGIKDSETDVSENKTICQQFCKGGGYVAIAPSYQCIQFQYLCNGYNNTLDGSDEIRKNCDVHCKALADLPKYRDDFFQLEPLGRCMVKVRRGLVAVKTDNFPATSSASQSPFLTRVGCATE
jgi:hypothetical protein